LSRSGSCLGDIRNVVIVEQIVDAKPELTISEMKTIPQIETEKYSHFDITAVLTTGEK
jgi:hypothetical protein